MHRGSKLSSVWKTPVATHYKHRKFVSYEEMLQDKWHSIKKFIVLAWVATIVFVFLSVCVFVCFCLFLSPFYLWAVLPENKWFDFIWLTLINLTGPSQIVYVFYAFCSSLGSYNSRAPESWPCPPRLLSSGRLHSFIRIANLLITVDVTVRILYRKTSINAHFQWSFSGDENANHFPFR